MYRANYNIAKLNEIKPEAKGVTVTKGTGGLELTLDVILKTIEENYEAMKPVAEILQGATPEQTCYNIWHYLKTETVYEHDKVAYEEIRTPQRLMLDKKGDCDDYSIFSASILKALGYEPYLWIVAFNDSKDYGHIYTGYANMVLDGVMDVFNVHPDHISKAMILKLNGKREVIHANPQYIKDAAMIIQQLSGLSDKQYKGFVNREFNRLNYQKNLSIPERENLNRLKVIKLLEGAGHSDLAKNLIPGVAGVDDNFNVYYNDVDEAEEADNIISEYEALRGLGDIDGLGKLFDKLKAFNKKVVAKTKEVVKKQVAKTKAVAKKVTNFVKKTGLAPARGAFLLLLRMNFLHMAEKLYITYLPEEDVKKMSISLEDFRKLVEFRKKFENFWEKSGGKKESLKDVVFTRGKKKADEKLKGLGVAPAVVAAGTVTAAAGPLGVFGKLWGAVKGVFSKVFGAIKNGAKKLGDKGKTIMENMSDATTEDIPEEYLSDGKTIDDGGSPYTGEESVEEPTKNKWIIPVAIAGTLAAIFIFK